MQTPAAADISSGINTISAILSALAVLVGALIAFIVIRVQRDMANLKNEILEGINGKYISRREHDILCREHESAMEKTEDTITEARRQHHILHEEFIACRAAHGGEKK